MLLGRIIGTVVATRKDPRLEGKKLLICRPIDPDGKDEKGYIVPKSIGDEMRVIAKSLMG